MHFIKENGKEKKNRKSHNFRDISKISRTNVLRFDTYMEKNHCDFLMVIFSVKKFFMENRVFLIFAKKLYKKFISLEKKSIIQKREMSRIVRRQVLGNGTEITARKFFLKKMEKKKFLLAEYSSYFYETFGNRVSCL